MKIKWNGHACFTITTGEGTVIVTDPYEPGGYDGAIKYGNVKDRVDIALVSHDHADHNYVEMLEGSPEVLKETGEAKGIRFNGIPCFHDETKGSERGPNTIFVFEVDGVKVAFAGDIGHQLSGDELKALADVDVLMVPVGGTFTVDARGAAALVQAIKPRMVIPMHFKTEKCAFPLASVDEFLKHMTNSKKLNKTEIKITPESLPVKGPEVWVMDYAC